MLIVIMAVIIKTRCPYCGMEQNSLVVARKRCVYCGHLFLIYPKNERARVVGIVKGSYEDYMREASAVCRRLEAKRRERRLKRKGGM